MPFILAQGYKICMFLRYLFVSNDKSGLFKIFIIISLGGRCGWVCKNSEPRFLFWFLFRMFYFIGKCLLPPVKVVGLARKQKRTELFTKCRQINYRFSFLSYSAFLIFWWVIKNSLTLLLIKLNKKCYPSPLDY